MSALFARSFSFISGAPGLSSNTPSPSPSFSFALPTSWIRRISASLKTRSRRSNNGKSAVGHQDTRHRKNTFLSEPSSSGTMAPSILSIPSLSRSHSASSGTTCASNGALSTLRPSLRSQTKRTDHDIIATLKAMQAFVPDSPRTSFIATFSPDLEVEEGSYSHQPSYVTHQPQLYPYTLSDDDLWAEQMVANILADHYRTKSV